MRRSDAIRDRGTGEVEELARAAALLRGLVGPVADARLLGEDQAVRTGDHVELAFDAVVEGVAVPRVPVGEVAVHARAVGRRGWRLCNCVCVFAFLYCGLSGCKFSIKQQISY